tara:strand:+ start:251 stop:1783 length:1533 start_codon:yes stop_codon:yes gene_type:complete
LKNFEIPYSDTKLFSKLVLDYINNDDALRPFINNFPLMDNFAEQISEKQRSTVDRITLVKVLKKQNANLILSKSSKSSINKLLDNQTLTVTTGHQLCLFGGPLYLFYKIISTLNLVEQLKENFPKNNFVPIFWMASEDHDFNEINHINIFGKKIVWDSKQSGAVGKMSLNNFNPVIDELKLVLGESKNAEKLMHIFKKSYLEHRNIADATRYLINYFFGEYGLIILDPDDKDLKKQIIPLIKKDVLNNGFVDTISSQSAKISNNHKVQAFVRDTNFFYLSDGKRELITENLSEHIIENSPHFFSPNVLLRPLYQEVILPNIAIVGGGAEIAYWMQLKTAFKKENIVFPILVMRNSALLFNNKEIEKFTNLGFNIYDIFKDENSLQKEYILSQPSLNVSLQKQKSIIKEIFDNLIKETDDIGLKKSINSHLSKQLSALSKLEIKLIRNEKKKHETSISKISKIKNNLFPENYLQERYTNFIPFYLTHGDNFIQILKDNLNPLNPNFVILDF